MSTRSRLERLAGTVGFLSTVGFLADKVGKILGQGHSPETTAAKPTVSTDLLSQYGINIESFDGLPYKSTDVVKVEKVTTDLPVPSPLEGIVDLMEGREHIFYIEMKEGKKLLVKPYKSPNERDVFSMLKKTGLTFALASGSVEGNPVFVEEVPITPTFEKILEGKYLSLPQVAGLLGEALFVMHSSGISYNQIFDNHVYVDNMERTKLLNFSHATTNSNRDDIRHDLIRAFRFLNSLSLSYKSGKFQLSRAIGSLSVPYLIDRSTTYVVSGTSDGLGMARKVSRNSEPFNARQTYMEAIDRVLSSEDPQSPLTYALNRLRVR